jgi:hypothetical protein
MTTIEGEGGRMKELELLKHAVSVIQAWHGNAAFDIYYNHAPEMKPIRERIEYLEKKSRSSDFLDQALNEGDGVYRP